MTPPGGVGTEALTAWISRAAMPADPMTDFMMMVVKEEGHVDDRVEENDGFLGTVGRPLLYHRSPVRR